MTDRRSAVIIALHDLHRNSRVLKQAGTLHDAGFDVTAVGIIRRSTDQERENTSFGRILRVRTTDKLYADRAESAQAAVSAAPRKSSASALVGLRMFLGRMRENLLMARAVVPLSPDVVIASDLSAWAAGVRVKRKTGAKLLLDVRDLVTDSGRDVPASYDKLLRTLERWAIRQGDAVTTVTPLMSEVLIERYPGVVPPTSIYNGPMSCLAPDVTVHRPLRLLFQGNLMLNRFVDKMIEATVSLHGAAVLAIQGFGEQKPELESLVERLGAHEWVSFIEPCLPHEVARSASKHDVGIISNWDDTLNMRISLGTKYFDYISGGLAVVASDLPMYREAITESGCGVLFDPREPGALAEALRKIADDTDEVLRMKRNAVAACPRYSWDVQGAKFLEVVNSVMDGDPRAQ